MAKLTEEQKTELTRSGVLKDLVGKSWDDPEVQKKANEYYNPSKPSGGSTHGGSSGGSSNNNTKPKPVYPKTIDDYKNDYNAAKAKGDSAGMQAANNAANAIRKTLGQTAQYANVDIAAVANANNTTSPYKYTTPVKKIEDYSNDYAIAKAKGDSAGMKAANDAANAIRRAAGQKEQIANVDISSVANANANKITPVNTDVKEVEAETPSSTEYPTTGSVWMTRPDGSQTAVSARELQKFLDKGYKYVGIRTNDTGLYSPSGDLLQSKSGTSSSSRNYAARAVNSTEKTNLNDLDNYTKLATNMLKPEFDKAVEEQMKALTNRMVAQGYQGQMPAEAMRAEIMSNLQADFQSQVSTLAQQLMQQDISNQRYADETAYNRGRDTIADTRYNTEYTDNRSDINYERTQNELDKSQKREIDNIMMYYSDLKAEADKRKATPDTSDDFLIPYLLALREEKKITEGLDDNGNKISAGGKLTYDQALKLWQTYGVATQGIADVLGVEVGAKTEDYLNTEYDIKKPYYKESSGSSGSNSTSKALNSYYDGFIAENMNTDGESLYANLVNNQSAYINEMGSANFTKAVKFARDKYYQTVISKWRGNESGLLKEIQSKPEYYQNVLGIENYNKMINDLGKSKTSSDGW